MLTMSNYKNTKLIYKPPSTFYVQSAIKKIAKIMKQLPGSHKYGIKRSRLPIYLKEDDTMLIWII